ncbi:MAG: hypothetical protein MAG795_00236 [Candidatus Woesearchaeota archaeon]|nr:hypothetical protein [Candidatus Woesearchaeota archaeon]
MIDLIKYIFRNVKHRKLRSWLTVLSILIGITAVFAILSFGLGLQNYMNTLADEAGADKLYIQAKGVGAPGTDENFMITQDDIDFVSRIRGVEEITAIYMDAGSVEYKDQIIYAFVMGINTDEMELFEESFAFEIEEGRALKDDDEGKVTLGYRYRIEDKAYEKPVRLGDEVKINDKVFDVVGFYEEVGNPADDINVYLTKSEFESLYNIKDEYGFAMVKSEKGVLPSELSEKITEKLRKHKDQKEGKEDFYVQTFEDILQTFGVIVNVLNGVLILIALISVVVACVNIMNTMYTAVLERTKEIGIMKAIGSTNSRILTIFLLESGILGLIGGAVGIGFGYLIATIGGKIAADSGFAALQPIFPWYLTVGCLVFSFLVGGVAGLLPSLQASKQKPVDSLRYE